MYHLLTTEVTKMVGFARHLKSYANNLIIFMPIFGTAKRQIKMRQIGPLWPKRQIL